MTLFSERLNYLIREKGVQKKDLAEYLGIKYRNLRFYETGERKPDFDGLLKLAEFFGVSIDYLVGRNEFEVNAQSPQKEKSIDEQLRDVISDPYEMAMFHDFHSASEEDKRMLLEIWKSIKNRSKERENGE